MRAAAKPRRRLCSPLGRRAALAVLAVLLPGLPACTSSTPTSPQPTPTPTPTPAPATAVFLLRACAGEGASGETFRMLTADPTVIATATSLIGGDRRLIVTGSLRSGDGGFNAPWRWHLDPADVTFAENTIELCDGCPHDLEDDLAYWLDTVGRYCPWSTEVLARER